MAIDLRDGIYGPPLRPPDDKPELPPEQKAAQVRERADEDAMFVAASRARLAKDQARAFRDSANEARQSGGVGFAGSFIDGFRDSALDAATRAQSPDFPGPRPGEQAVGAFLNKAERDANLFLDRAAAVETVSRAVKRQRDGLAALDDIRQSAFDDPDGVRDARERQDDVITALFPDLPGEEARPLRESERKRLAEAAIQGRIAAAPHEAMRELDDSDAFPELPHDRRAALKESAERRMAAEERDAGAAEDREARRAVLDLAAEERRFSARFLSRAENGEATDAELEDAIDRGAITRTRAASLRTARQEADERQQVRLEQVTAVQQAVDAGEPLDPRNADHVRAAETYWERIVLPIIRDTPPEDRPAVILSYLRDISVIPQGMRRALRAMWASGNPEMRRAVAEIFRRAEMGPARRLTDALATEFSPRERRVQAHAVDLIDIGIETGPAFERAEEIEPQTVPATDGPPETTPVSGDGETGAAGEGGDTSEGGVEESALTEAEQDEVAPEEEPDGVGPDGDNEPATNEQAASPGEAGDVPSAVAPTSGFAPEAITQIAQASAPDSPLRLTPEQTKEARDNFAKIQENGVSGLTREQKINVLKSLVGKKKLTEPQKRAVSQIYRNTPLDEEFVKLDEAKQQRFLSALGKDPIILNAEKKGWSRISNQEKLKIFEHVVEKHAQLYGYPPPKVELKELKPKAPAGRDTKPKVPAGRYIEASNTIQINPLRKDFRDSPGKTIGSVAHEATHAYQSKLARDYAAGKIPKDDPRFGAAELFALNSGELYFRSKPDQDRYLNQPREAHISKFQQQVINMDQRMFLERMKRESGR